ncbi:MAG TPA: sulfite dehydrogenase, partial [Dehalococcoidia bacterium]|nr:sulfite dehydrogenase [Dehalococcoidia bacterium]
MAFTGDFSRRNFLKNAGITGAGVLLTANQIWAAERSANMPPNVPSWMQKAGTGVGAAPYGAPSTYESEAIRRTVPWLTATPISSVSFSPLQSLQGIITPSSLHFERHHSGVPDIDPNEHRLMIHGLCKNPLVFGMDDLTRFPSVSEIRFIECPANGGMEWRGPQMEALQFTHGMISCSEWTGVRLSTLLAEVGIDSKAKWVLAEGADGAAMARSIPIDKALDDVIVAYAQNGEMIRPEQGYPLRLVNPGWEGNTSVKWLRRLELGDKPWHLREETSKYTD